MKEKKKEEQTVFVQTAPSKSHPFGAVDRYVPLMTPEARLYASLAEGIPIISAAIQKTVRLVGGFKVECNHPAAEKGLQKFLNSVRVGSCSQGIDAFICPGHVSVITGSDAFQAFAEKYQRPFVVAGFEGEEILDALYGIVKAYRKDTVMNFYPQVVNETGNKKAQALVDKYFVEADAAWRGMGIIPMTGKILRDEYAQYDAGSVNLTEDNKKNKACCCDKILMGKMEPTQCPLFGKVCKPLTPQGACMVSEEGSCRSRFITGEYC